MSKMKDIAEMAAHKFCSAVVVAAGSSERMGADKLALTVGGVPVLASALLALEGCGCIDEIVVVTRADKLNDVAALRERYALSKVKSVVAGGATRTESALAGVSETDRRAKVICIHDGARPFVTEDIVRSAVRAALEYKSAAPAVPVKDTIRIVRDGAPAETPPRERVMAMQTPQAFDADLIKAALTKAVQEKKSYTDDCAAVEALGVPPHLTEGSEENIKITTPTDLAAAESIAARRKGGAL